MKKRILMLFSSFVVITLVLAIPSELLADRLASPEPSPEPIPAQQEEKQALVDDILYELNLAKGMTNDAEVINMLEAIIDRVRKLGWLEFTNQEVDALRLKLVIAEHLEKLINELPLASAGATTAVAAMPASNPLYDELVRVRAKIEKLIEMERGVLEPVPPPPPTISRLPEADRLLVYSAKFLCGPAFGSEGVQRGSYSTAVNVHNPHNGRVVLYKKAVVANREDDPRGKISGFRRVVLGPDEAIEIDCLDIESLLRTHQDLTRMPTSSQEPGTALTTAPQGQQGQQEGGLTTATIQTGAISPVSNLVRFVKGFVVIYASAPLDVVAVYTASTPVGFSLDVEYLSPSAAATIPFTPPTEETKCPRGCSCLTREEALEKGLTAWCGGELKICEYDDQQNPLRYCFEEPTQQTVCPDGCQCLTVAEARQKNLPLCPGETRPCSIDADGNEMYCYRGAATECPPECECLALSPEVAKEKGLNLCGNREIRCGTDVAGVVMYCYERATGEECPSGCQCLALTAEEAELKGLTLCTDAPCGTAATTGQTMYCYKRKAEVECPQGCQCLALTPNEAGERGLTLCADYQCGTDTAGKAMYCYKATEVECPQGCECLALTAAEAERKGLALCADAPCGINAAGQTMYCYREMVELLCPVGCQCLALTPAEAERKGLKLCADYQCGTDAAGNAMYCYEEETETVCPSGCECLTVAKAEELGYTLCNGQRTICGYDAQQNVMYCYEKTSTDDCPAGCGCYTQAEAKRLGYPLCGNQWIPCGYVPGGPDKWCYQDLE